MANKPARPSPVVPVPGGGMGAFARPTTGSAVLDDVMRSATGAHPVVPAPVKEPADPPAASEPEPPARDERPVGAVEAERPVVAPRSTSRRATGRARARGQSRYQDIPPMPDRFAATRKPLQVYLDPQEHWALKQGTFARAVDMSAVVAALVTIFNENPDQVLGLMELAEEQRVTLGELLGPALRATASTA